MKKLDTAIFINSPEIPRLIYLLFFRKPLIPKFLKIQFFFERSSYFIKQNECRKDYFFAMYFYE